MKKRHEQADSLVDSSLLAASMRLVSVDKTGASAVDVLPVRMDIGLGERFDYIGFDDAAILTRMRSEGLSESQIAQLPIHVSAATPQAPNAARHLGSFNAAEKQIALYPNAYLDDIQDVHEEIYRAMGVSELTAFAMSAPDEAIAQEMAGTIYHEIRHARHHLVDTAVAAESKRHHRRARLPVVLGLTATQLALLGGNFAANSAYYGQGDVGFAALTFMTTLSGIYATRKVADRMLDKKWPHIYLNDPGEIDARIAQTEAPDTVVQLITKSDALRMGYETHDTSQRTLIARLLGNVSAGLR